ncbi:hypothetical protein Adt_29791 [Abeliophyllum distichum]|uniref:Uncharacterized protein n=1 Tax=Abeliophyllum distichum TaxID=126358 RepID=A0ABD1R9E4_9LAMI
MEDPTRTHPNAPTEPTMPSDNTPHTVGLLLPTIPNPNTGLTPPTSGPLAQTSLQFTATLGLDPSEAAALSAGDTLTGRPPLAAPPLGEPFEGSFAAQTSPLAVLNSSPSRVPLPAFSGPLAETIPPSISELPNSATVVSSHLIAPRLAQTMLPNAEQRTPLPAPQAQPSAPV